jgi:hypothetical protein
MELPNGLFVTRVQFVGPPLCAGGGAGVCEGVPEAATGPTVTHEDGAPSPALFTADTLK